MRFTQELWQTATPVYERILHHPFLQGLTSGSLPEQAFRFYVIQDSHYLRDFARGLAILGAKATEDDTLSMFCHHAANAIAVERALHESFYSTWQMPAHEVWQTPVAPNCLLYTSYLMRVAYERPWAEGLAAFLPCYWVYMEVGKELEKKGSPHPLFQQWIDTYASAEFEAVVRQVLEVTDAAALRASDAERRAMHHHFLMSTRFEYLFWDMGWNQQVWEV